MADTRSVELASADESMVEEDSEVERASEADSVAVGTSDDSVETTLTTLDAPPNTPLSVALAACVGAEDAGEPEMVEVERGRMVEVDSPPLEEACELSSEVGVEEMAVWTKVRGGR